MAIRKTGSRRIVVDGVTYRWRVRPRATYCEAAFATGMSVAVQLADQPGQVLLVRCAARPDNWLGVPGTVVSPNAVERAVRAALASGWVPDAPGSAFVFDLTRGQE